MSASAAGPPLHRRSVVVETSETRYDGAVALLLAGRLLDERPGPDGAHVVHDMRLTLTIRLDDAIIVAADAGMASFPHAECPLIAPAFAALVGMSVARGYGADLRQALGGISGCAHLYELARSMGAAVMQGRASYGASRRRPGVQERLPVAAVSALRGTCHLWAAGGVGEQKLAAGWLPGGSYPAPPLQEILAHAASARLEERHD